MANFLSAGDDDDDNSSSEVTRILQICFRNEKRLNLSFNLSTATVDDLKATIAQRSSIPQDKQRLFYSGRELRNTNKTLEKVGVGKQGMYSIHVVSSVVPTLVEDGQPTQAQQDRKPAAAADDDAVVIINSTIGSAKRSNGRGGGGGAKGGGGGAKGVGGGGDDADNDDVICLVNDDRKKAVAAKRRNGDVNHDVVDLTSGSCLLPISIGDDDGYAGSSGGGGGGGGGARSISRTAGAAVAARGGAGQRSKASGGGAAPAAAAAGSAGKGKGRKRAAAVDDIDGYDDGRPFIASGAGAAAAADGEAEGGKKRRKSKVVEEKRKGRLKAKLSQKDVARRDRSLTQRMYMVRRDNNSTEGDIRNTFAVLGSSGNVYKVEIAQEVRCTCPDHAKGNICKHIFFTFLKVLRVSQNDSVYWQKYLLQSELERVLGPGGTGPAAGESSVLANIVVRKTYNAIAGIEEDDDEEGGGAVGGANPEQARPLDEGDDCPVCFEELKENGAEELVFCRAGCKKSLHKDCFQRWSRQQTAAGKEVTCVYCRQRWESAPMAQGGAAAMAQVQQEDGYVNMAALSGQSPQRDASSYSEWFNRRRTNWPRGGGGRRAYGRDYEDYH